MAVATSGIPQPSHSRWILPTCPRHSRLNSRDSYSTPGIGPAANSPRSIGVATVIPTWCRSASACRKPTANSSREPHGYTTPTRRPARPSGSTRARLAGPAGSMALRRRARGSSGCAGGHRCSSPRVTGIADRDRAVFKSVMAVCSSPGNSPSAMSNGVGAGFCVFTGQPIGEGVHLQIARASQAIGCPVHKPNAHKTSTPDNAVTRGKSDMVLVPTLSEARTCTAHEIHGNTDLCTNAQAAQRVV